MIEFDTTLFLEDRKTWFKKRITLERPSIIYLHVNGVEDEIFLSPGQNNNLHIVVDSSNINIRFEDQDLRNINKYYLHKATIGGDPLMRPAITGALSLPTLAQVYDSIIALECLLERHLLESKVSCSLPKWFEEYEKKNIK